MGDAHKQDRRRWLASGSTAALALGLVTGLASGAQAQTVGPRIDNTQAVQATATVTQGAATTAITRSATRDTVTLSTNATIINWTTLDTANNTSHVNFLPQGTELLFQSGTFDYTVLNRVIAPANGAGGMRGIAFGGTVNSVVNTNFGPVTGGNIWFYSAGGILVTPGAAFNVGSLILSTSDIQAINDSNQIDFLGTSDSFSSVIIQEGASITAPGDNGYAIVFAPTITQAGTVDINGSTLYMSAEAGSVFLDGNGGFNFYFATQNAQPGNGITHTGITTGPASVPLRDSGGNLISADPHAIEFFAAGSGLDILIEGRLGYEPAAAASQDANGTIFLQASEGSVSLGDATLTSSATIFAGAFDLTVGNGESFLMGGDPLGNYNLEIIAGTIAMIADPGGEIAIDGDVILQRLSSSAATMTIAANGDPDGVLPAGNIAVGGDLLAFAGLNGFSSGGQGDPPAPGRITVDINNGGGLTVGGDFVLDASSVSEILFDGSDPIADEAQGGSVTLTLSGAASSLSVGGELALDASAGAVMFSEGNFSGGDSFFEGSFIGGDATGGSVDIAFAEGTVTLGGLSARANASATPGNIPASDGATADAQGGTVTIDLGNANVTTGYVSASASAFGVSGAAGEAGGSGTGGTVLLTKGSGGFFSSNSITLHANGFGGDGRSDFFGADGGDGGAGTGGSARLVSAMAIDDLGFLDIGAGGFGGSGGDGSDGSAGGVGGAGTGGLAELAITSSDQVLDGLVESGIFAGGIGGRGGSGGSVEGPGAAGQGGRGGDGEGGQAIIDIGGDGALFVFDGSLFMSAEGAGGFGGRGGEHFSDGQAGNGGAGGSGTGGVKTLLARSGGTIQLALDSESTFGEYGYGGQGGNGGDIGAESIGTVGNGGNGGNGTGGTAELLAIGGTILSGALQLEAIGYGGDGGMGGTRGGFGVSPGLQGNGGAGAGGNVVLATEDGSPGVFTLGAVTIDSSGIAGGGTVVGNAAGGQITITDGSVDPAGLITMDSLTVTVGGLQTAPGTPSFTMSGSSGPITILSDMSVTVAADANYMFDGTGQVVVGGASTVNAAGNINVAHTNNPGGLATIDSTGAFSATAGGNFNGGPGSIIASASNVDIVAQSISFGSIFSGLGTVLNALSGGIAGGDIESDDLAHMAATGDIAVGSILADGDVLLDAGGSVTAGSLEAAAGGTGQLDVSAGTSILVDSFAMGNAGGTASFTAPTVQVNSGTSAGDLSIFANAGDILSNGTITVQGAIDLDARDDIQLAQMEAGQGFAIDAGGTISYATLINGTNDLVVNAGVAITGGAAQSDGAAVFAAPGNISMGDVTGGEGVTIGSTDGNVSFGTLQSANDDVAVTAAGSISGAAAIALGGADDGGLDRVLLTAGGDVVLTGTARSVEDGVFVTSGGSATLGGVDAANEVEVIASGAVNISAVAQRRAGFSTSIDGASVTLGSLVGTSTATLQSSSGDVTITGALTNAGSVDILSARAVSTGNLSTGGALLVQAATDISTGNLQTGGNATLDAGGDLTSGDATVGGGIALDAAGDISFGTMEAQGGDFLADAGGDIAFDNASASGAVDFGANGSIAATGDVTAGTGLQLGAFGGSLTVRDLVAGGDIDLSVQQTMTGRDIVQSGGALSISALGGVTFEDASGSGDAGITTSGDMSFNSLETAGEVSLLALGDVTGSTIDAGGDTSIDGFNITLDSVATSDGTIFAIADGGTLAIGSMSAPEDIFAIATGSVQVDTAVAGESALFEGEDIALGTVDAGNDIEALAGSAGGLTADALTAGNAVSVSAGTGGIWVGQLTAASADLSSTGAIDVDLAAITGLLLAHGADISIRSNDALTADLIATAGNIAVLADDGLTVNSADASGNMNLASFGTLRIAGAATAGGTLALDTFGTLEVDASVVGQVIEVAAADIAISSGGRLGDATRTEDIRIFSRGDMLLGGEADGESGFQLDADEIARIHSGGDLFFAVENQEGASGDIVVRSVEVAAGDGSSADAGTFSSRGRLTLFTAGDVRVEGELTVTGAGAETVLELDAGNLVRIDSTAGGVALLDSNGGLAGTIAIEATDFIAATDAAFEDIQGMTTEQIDERLAQNDGVVRPDGVIRADALTIETTGSRVFIQNTGEGTDFADRRGFTVNSLRISDSGESSSTQPIVINGVVNGKTGLDAIPETAIDSNFDSASTINGCEIASPSSCRGLFVPNRPIFNISDIPLQDLIEEEIRQSSEAEDGVADGDEGTMLIEINTLEDPALDPLIDDPVTGAGNENLWQPPEEECEPGESDEECPAE